MAQPHLETESGPPQISFKDFVPTTIASDRSSENGGREKANSEDIPLLSLSQDTVRKRGSKKGWNVEAKR